MGTPSLKDYRDPLEYLLVMLQPNVVPINSYQRPSSTVPSGTSGSTSGQIFSITVEKENVIQRTDAKVLSPAELYPDLQAQDGRVIQALLLLRECGDYLQSAIRIDPKTDFIGYDEKMMRARNSLRRLYALREIGDGFGAVINAMIWALRNKDSETLTSRQISTVVEVLNQLRKKPLLHFDSSMNLLDQLEDSDLNIEPPFMDLLTEVKNE
jgi:hypothetical protein